MQLLYFKLVGAALLAWATYLLANHVLYLRAAQPATATVLALRTNLDKRGRDNGLLPVVRFTTPQGQVVTARGPSGSATPTYAVGDEVPLLYDPAQPRRVQFPDFFSTWGEFLLAAVLAGFGRAWPSCCLPGGCSPISFGFCTVLSKPAPSWLSCMPTRATTT